MQEGLPTFLCPAHIIKGADEGTLKLFRSKGRREGEGRVCVLSERSRRLLEEYLYNERSAVEGKL